MLILTRKIGEPIIIPKVVDTDSPITFTVLGVSEDKVVRIGISAPPEIKIWRQEVWDNIETDRKSAEAKHLAESGDSNAADGGITDEQKET